MTLSSSRQVQAGRRTTRGRSALAAGLIAVLSWAMTGVPGQEAFPIQTALATANTNCNLLQTDNTWIQRTQSWSSVSSATAYISYFDYNLCVASTNPLYWPIQTSSAAWVGIVSSSFGSDIMQAGEISCGINQVLGCGNFSSGQRAVPLAFWAWGVNGDPFHQPFPHPMGSLSTADHLFRVFKVNRTSCYWALTMDQGTPGYIFTTVPCSSIPWTPTVAYIANEVWDSGDQLGGYSGTPQHFYGEWFADSSGHAQSFQGQPYGPIGHCYPQAAWSDSSGHGDDWRSWTYVASHSPC